jgi:hypothetical protein
MPIRSGDLSEVHFPDAAKIVLVQDNLNAWQDHRNKHHAKANWQFKTADAASSRRDCTLSSGDSRD